MGGLDLAPGCYTCCEENFFLTTSVERLSSAKNASAGMDVNKGRNVAAATGSPRSASQLVDDAQSRVSERCEAYECLRRDVLRCSADKDDEAILRTEAECASWKPLQSSIRQQREFSGLA